MAYKDGMTAISKTLKAVAILLAACAFSIAVVGGFFENGGAAAFFGFSIAGVALFLLF